MPKKCQKCFQLKPTIEFYAKRASPDGLSPYCKECTKAQVYASREKRHPSKSDKSSAGVVFVAKHPAYPDYYKVCAASDLQTALAAYNTLDPHEGYSAIFDWRTSDTATLKQLVVTTLSVLYNSRGREWVYTEVGEAAFLRDVAKICDAYEASIPTDAQVLPSDPAPLNTHKTCKDCGETKPVEEFYASTNHKGGRRSSCISCCSKQQAARYSAKRDAQGAKALTKEQAEAQLADLYAGAGVAIPGDSSPA